MINPFTNATSVSCGSKVDTFQAVIGARLRLNCGLDGSTTTVISPTCVRGVTEALHSCSGLKSSVRTFCVADARPDLGCGIWRWTECIANILAVSISCGGNPRCIIANIPSSCEGCYCIGECGKI